MKVQNNTPNVNFKGGVIFKQEALKPIANDIAKAFGQSVFTSSVKTFKNDNSAGMIFYTPEIEKKAMQFIKNKLNMNQFIYWSKVDIDNVEAKRFTSLSLDVPNSERSGLEGVIKMKTDNSFHGLLFGIRRHFPSRQWDNSLGVAISDDKKEINISILKPEVKKYALDYLQRLKTPDYVYLNNNNLASGFSDSFIKTQVYN